jgi:hypothetical protein
MDALRGEDGGTRNKKRVNDAAAGNYLSACPIERSNGRTKAGIAFDPGRYRVTRYCECRGVGGEEEQPARLHCPDLDPEIDVASAMLRTSDASPPAIRER